MFKKIGQFFKGLSSYKKKYDGAGSVFDAFAADALVGDALPLRKMQVLFKDAMYCGLSEKQFMELYQAARWQCEDKYLDEGFDCDDFTQAALTDVRRYWAKNRTKPEALFCGWIDYENDGVAPHEMMWFITDSGEIKFIDPQTDKLVEWRQEYKPFAIG